MSTRNSPTQTPTRPAPGGFTRPGPLAPVPGNSNVPALIPKKSRRLIRLDTYGGQFSGLVLVCVILSAAALAVSFFVLSSVKNNFNDIITNSAPSITAAQRLGQSIQQADVSVADYQLTSRIDVTNPDYNASVYGDKGLRATVWDNFLQRRQDVSNLIYAAQKNITYAGEADAIAVINNRFLDYVARVNVMKYELDRGNREEALAAYKSAHDLLVGNLNNVNLSAEGRTPEEQSKLNNWPDLTVNPNSQLVASQDCQIGAKPLGIEANIQKLTAINNCQLKKASDAALASVSTYTLLVIALTVLLVLGLALLSFRYAVTTHRVINPGYALALIAALIVAIFLSLNLLQSKTDYNTVAVDSFISIDAASKIRQLAADANADESRLLLSPETPGLDSTSAALTADIRKAFQANTLNDNFQKKRDLLQKQIQIAWNNVTYRQEVDFLCQVAQSGTRCPANSKFALNDYSQLDTQIRDAFSKNLLAQAIKIDIGDSNAAFTRFDNAIIGLSKVNETEFDNTACRVMGVTQFGASCNNQGYVKLWEVGVWIVFPLIALATVGGYWFARRQF